MLLVFMYSIYRFCSCPCPVFFAAGHAIPLNVKAGFLLNDIFFDCTTTTTYAILMVYAKQMVCLHDYYYLRHFDGVCQTNGMF